MLQLKEKNPDVAIFISYTSDAIPYTKTMKELGFSDPDRRQCWLQRSGLHQGPAPTVEGLVNWSGRRQAARRPSSTTLTRRRPGVDLDDVRCAGLLSFLVMADVLNRAGSDPAKICDGPQGDRPAGQPRWSRADGVKFDDKGQNVLASSVVTQLRAASIRSGPRHAPPPK